MQQRQHYIFESVIFFSIHLNQFPNERNSKNKWMNEWMEWTRLDFMNLFFFSSFCFFLVIWIEENSTKIAVCDS